MRRLLLAKRKFAIVSLTALLGLWGPVFGEENQRSSEVELQQNSADELLAHRHLVPLLESEYRKVFTRVVGL